MVVNEIAILKESFRIGTGSAALSAPIVLLASKDALGEEVR